jgi:peptidoglycan DL-endopeptidase CwlO
VLSSVRTSTVAVSTVTVGALAVTGGILAPAAFGAPDYPSWDDVQQAKNSEAATRAAVDRVTDLLVGLQEAADSTGIVALQKGEAYAQATLELDAATEKVDQLTSQAEEAADRALTSRMRAGLLASHLARAGGDASMKLFLSGADADDLLYQLGTASKLSESTQGVYEEAVADRNEAHSLGEQAEVAKKERAELADRASAALAEATIAAESAQAALSEQLRKNDELLAQLALLKDSTAELEAQYIAGLTRPVVEVAEPAAAAASGTPAGRAPSGGGAPAASPAAPAPAAPATRPAPATPAAPAAPAARPAPVAPAPAAPAPAARPAPAAPAPVAPAPAPAAPAPAAPAPAAPAPSAGAPNAGIAQGAIAFARAQIGKPYVLGGAGPATWDCSGLMMKAYGSVGVYIGAHGVTSQYNTLQSQGKLVPFSQRQPGDIIFWGSLNGSKYHDAIYIGGNQIIAAPKPGDVVKQQPLWGSDIVPYVGRPSA